MELKPKIGIDNLKFGMTQKEVIEILGNPDRIFHLDDHGDSETIFEWHEKLLRLTFYKDENDRLGYIRTMHPELNYKGNPIIRAKSELVMEQGFPEVQEWEKDEFEFLTMYFNEAYWLSLNCEYGVVLDVEMGVPFKNDETYDWP